MLLAPCICMWLHLCWWRPLPTYKRPVVCMSTQHAQSCIRHMGTVNEHGYDVKENTLFVMLVGHTTWFKAYWHQFFTKFDGFVVLTSCSGAYIETWWYFLDNNNDDDNDNDDTTDYLPLTHVRGVIITWLNHHAGKFCRAIKIYGQAYSIVLFVSTT